MLFKSAIVLLSAVLQTAVSTAHSTNDEQLEPRTNFVRKVKKDRQKITGEEDEAIVINDGEMADEDGESVPGNNPALRSSARLQSNSDGWNHGSFAVSSPRSDEIKVYTPQGTLPGDTLFLFLSITDGLLPIRINGWQRGAECFKTNNRQEECLRMTHCEERDGPYCLRFERDGVNMGNGRDLATVMFYRRVTAADPGCLTITLPSRSKTWAIVTAISNVNEDSPIFNHEESSCDRTWGSTFPSVYGKRNDVLLLSQCFDDTALRRDFQAPDGTQRLGFTNSDDEAGFLFGKKLDSTGDTGDLVTNGDGGPKCKDALLSIVVNRDA